jgi:hypothetical protein
MREFGIFLGVGNVAARRHIDVMEFDAARQHRHGMAAILALAPALISGLGQGNSRQDGDAVIALHAVDQHVLVAHRGDRLTRKELVRRLGLLQADDVGL